MGEKMGAKKKATKSSKLSKAVGVGKKLMGMGGKSGGKRRHKKSAVWYAKNIQRIKLKRKYEKLLYKVN